MSSYAINYCVLLPDEKLTEYSPFQGFPMGLVTRSWVFSSIAQLFPPTILELYRPSVRTLQHRIAGAASYRAFPLVQSELTKAQISPKSPFWVIVADDETIEAAKRWKADSEIPPLIIRLDEDFKGDNLRQRMRDRLYDHCEEVFSILEQGDDKWVLELAAELRRERWPDAEIDFTITYRSHNTTTPNESALLSAGCTFDEQGPALNGEDGVYVAAIVQSADELDRLRNSVPATNLYDGSPPPCTLIVSAPALYRHMYQLRQPKGKRAAADFFKTLRIIQKQSTYAFQGDEESMRVVESDAGKDVLHTRTVELHTYTSAIVVRAASHFCPVLRLPPAANHVMPQVIQLTDTLFARQPHILKIEKMATLLFDQLTRVFPPEFIERIDQDHPHVKVIADAPLEWVPIRGLPLMLRQSTSRIPATPGSLSFGTIIPPADLRLTMSAFQEILVVRSFRRNDPLRDHLRNAVGAYRLSDGSEMPVRFVDVSNRTEFAAALNDFGGALAVFDGHGVHGKGDDAAKLILANEDVNIWDLRGEARMPPIFFACACDTHAVNRSHATVANGLLYCGARTAIAAMLPIRSTSAALFVSRLLYRVLELIPSVVGGWQPKTVRWDEVFHVAQRLMFVSELLHAVADPDQFDKDEFTILKTHCIFLANTAGRDWFEALLDYLGPLLGKSESDLRERQKSQLPFAETLKYLQLGNPESIVICPEEVPERWFEDLEATTRSVE